MCSGAGCRWTVWSSRDGPPARPPGGGWPAESKLLSGSVPASARCARASARRSSSRCRGILSPVLVVAHQSLARKQTTKRDEKLLFMEGRDPESRRSDGKRQAHTAAASRRSAQHGDAVASQNGGAPGASEWVNGVNKLVGYPFRQTGRARAIGCRFCPLLPRASSVFEAQCRRFDQPAHRHLGEPKARY